MAAGTRYPIVLDSPCHSLLQRIAGSRTAAAGEVRRAQVLLARAAREPVRRLCRRLHCSSALVAKVCARFHAGGWEEARRELPRGRPPRRDAGEQETVCEWAQTPPTAHGLPSTRWSLDQFRQHYQLVHPTREPPSRSSLQRWLKAAHLLWWRNRSWCTTDDPNCAFKERLVCDAYLHAPAHYVVLCYDQTPHLQALARRVGHRACRPGQPGRTEHDYRRRGTADFHCLLDTRSGQCRGQMTWRHDQHIILVIDNLSANHAPAVRAALQHLRKVVLVFRTPTHSSWLNQVECVFADLQRQLLDLLEVKRVGELARAVGCWLRDRNTRAKPYRWRYHPDSRLSGTGHERPSPRHLRPLATPSLFSRHIGTQPARSTQRPPRSTHQAG